MPQKVTPQLQSPAFLCNQSFSYRINPINSVFTAEVQGTNDSSIVSKFSAANKGYFHDDCLKMFVNEKSRKERSPLINRGYYIRFKAMETVFDNWFAAVASSKSLVNINF
ncbi:hypothetical protein CEXT_106491 [Caerostris extrusa]|uniref:Uncharacterized protein n=1 Tax=Caerostris extrusa TaxID=172846 RepID=A0AAV4VYK2_CAEEX|nr:hypothetical protein CEXT_106491 [Caerostris extrusa]